MQTVIVLAFSALLSLAIPVRASDPTPVTLKSHGGTLIFKSPTGNTGPLLAYVDDMLVTDYQVSGQNEDLPRKREAVKTDMGMVKSN